MALPLWTQKTVALVRSALALAVIIGLSTLILFTCVVLLTGASTTTCPPSPAELLSTQLARPLRASLLSSTRLLHPFGASSTRKRVARSDQL